MNAEILTPSRKAHHTARWARTMTKWLIKFAGHASTKWQVVEFGGVHGAESRGVVDLLAIRKDHSKPKPGSGLNRGDYFEMVLIQVKGGSAASPPPDDEDRLRKVQSRYSAKAVVLAEWKKRKWLKLSQLTDQGWLHVVPKEIFGTQKSRNGGMASSGTRPRCAAMDLLQLTPVQLRQAASLLQLTPVQLRQAASLEEQIAKLEHELESLFGTSTRATTSRKLH